MKKIFQFMKKKPNLLCMANAFAMIMLLYSANTTCMWAQNQPEMPDAVRKYRKF